MSKVQVGVRFSTNVAQLQGSVALCGTVALPKYNAVGGFEV
jgi:hypothetical protein